MAVLRYALRTQAAWDAMSGPEQAVYAAHYTSMTTWWTTECASYDFVTNGNIKRLEVFDDQLWGLAYLNTSAGYSASNTAYPEICAAAGHEHGGVLDAGVHFAAAIGYAGVLNTNADHLHLLGVQFEALTAGNGRPIQGVATMTGLTIRRCILKTQTSPSGYGCGVYVCGTNTTFDSNIFVNCAQPFYTGFGGGVVDFTNNVTYNCQYGYSGGATTGGEVRNNAMISSVVASFTTDRTAYGVTYSNNAATDAESNTPFGSDPYLTNISTTAGVDFEDVVNSDFRVVSTSGLNAAGYNLYDGTGTQTDITGDLYPVSDAWPIGADYYVNAGADTSLDGTASSSATAAGALTTQIPIASAAISAATAQGSLSTGIPLGGAAATVTVAGGNLSAQITLAGDAIAQAIAAAGLSSQILLAGAAGGSASATGELAGSGAALGGAAGASATALGDLTVQIRLQGAAIAQAFATGALTAPTAGLGGSAQASATAAGGLTTAIPILGAAASVTDASGALTAQITLAGAAASVSQAIGSLDLALTLSGDALAQAAAAGSLTTEITLAGSALSSAAAAGTLAGGAYLPPPAFRLGRVRPESRVLVA